MFHGYILVRMARHVVVSLFYVWGSGGRKHNYWDLYLFEWRWHVTHFFVYFVSEYDRKQMFSADLFLNEYDRKHMFSIDLFLSEYDRKHISYLDILFEKMTRNTFPLVDIFMYVSENIHFPLVSILSKDEKKHFSHWPII